MTLFAKDTLFRSPFNPVDAHEALFYRIKQCQEIQVLACDPYLDMQVINNAVRMLMQASIFLLKEFNNWEADTPKTYPALKTFIATAYIRCILAQQLHNTAGQQGYTPTSHNMYTVFANKDNTDTTATATTNIAALTTGSTIIATITKLVANAIDKLSANQTVLMNQMAAESYANAPHPPNQQYQPPTQQLTIPVEQPFARATLGGFNHGHGGGSRGGHSRQGRSGRGGGRNQHSLFANFGCNQGGRDVGQGHGGGRNP
jgi:hypothetical protein